MDKHRVKLVQESYARALPHKAELASRFYDHLFRDLPAARPMFHKDMYLQKEMFATMLAMIVKGASNPEEFATVGKRLSSIHKHAKVNPTQYQFAVDAVLSALRDILKDDFDLASELAWKDAMQELVSYMGPLTKG